ncbi:MAG: alpha/beta hydrolase [Deltaproteobacteria bacterium]|nr:alpha/beta hydrolase [Deltaproteobacteria bacterium]
MEVAERRVVANGLGHHAIVWSPPRDRVSDDAPTLLCVHGFLDLAWSFRGVAERLVARGLRVIAVDWRGHAESDWVGPGGYYYFADYVADLADLVEELVPGRLHLFGHSMGGSAALLYAGAFPDRVERLMLAEGLGPPEPADSSLPERMANWVRECREARARRDNPLVMPDVDAALARMKRTNPDLPDALGRELAARGTRPVEGGVVWRWDPLHRTRGPYPFRKEDFLSFARAVRCPVLVIDGEHGFRTADHAERLAAFRDVRTRAIPATGHMMHWTAPDAVADAISNGW